MHCLGIALSSQFHDVHYLSTLVHGGYPRGAPNCDKEVASGVMEGFNIIVENSKTGKLLPKQFANFHLKIRLSAIAAAQIYVVTINNIE